MVLCTFLKCWMIYNWWMIDPYFTGQKMYKCDICHHEISSSGNLKIHMRKHTGILDWKNQIRISATLRINWVLNIFEIGGQSCSGGGMWSPCTPPLNLLDFWRKKTFLCVIFSFPTPIKSKLIFYEMQKCWRLRKLTWVFHKLTHFVLIS